jgi:hypothetical protein
MIEVKWYVIEIFLFVLYMIMFSLPLFNNVTILEISGNDVVIFLLISSALSFIATILTESVVLLILYLHQKAESIK